MNTPIAQTVLTDAERQDAFDTAHQRAARALRPWREQHAAGLEAIERAVLEKLATQEPLGEMVGHHAVGVGEMPTIRWRDGYWPALGTRLYAAPVKLTAVALTCRRSNRSDCALFGGAP